MSTQVLAPKHFKHIQTAFSQLGQLDRDLDLNQVLQVWTFGSEHSLCRPYKTVELYGRQYRRWLCAESCLYRDRIESHRDELVDPNPIEWNPVPYPTNKLAQAMPYGVRQEVLLCAQHLLYRTMMKNNRGGQSDGPVHDFWYIRHLVRDFARSLRQDHCGKPGQHTSGAGTSTTCP